MAKRCAKPFCRVAICCTVACRSVPIERADRLSVTLLHPDAVSLASASHPLDDRALSIALHGLALAPTSIYAQTTDAAATEVLPDLNRTTREPFRDDLHGPDMRLPSGARLGRVKTHRGTVIFADAKSGMLRHGPEISSPNNVILANNDETAYLFYSRPDGERQTVRIGPERSGSSREQIADEIPAGIQAFRMLPVVVDERSWFGLQSCGLLLCAEDDGRITLSRSILGPWERFELLEEIDGGSAKFCKSNAKSQVTTLKQTDTQPEHITISGTSPETRLAVEAQSAFNRAMVYDGKLSDEILTMEGMSGRKARFFLNNLISSLSDARYLEIGVWRGSTLCSAIYGNQVTAVAIDNWSQFGNPVSEFVANLEKFKGKAEVRIIETDFREARFSTLGKYNVYTFDGPHLEPDQYDGVALVLPALDDEFILIVDDWNWAPVRNGTLQAIANLKLHVDLQIEVRTTLDDTHAKDPSRQHSDWHNGYFIAALRKSEEFFMS